MTKLKRWLPLVALILLVNVKSSTSLPVEEHGKLNNTTLNVPSDQVVRTQDKNESSSLADSRKAMPAYEPLASPADLLRPDRFQFYTFNNNGEVVTKQMTEKEIQSLIAAGGGHYPMEIHVPMKTENMVEGSETKVSDVVQNVQNVLKGELSKPTTMMVPVPTVPGHATDEWSNILPSILSGDSGDKSHSLTGESSLDEDKSTISVKPMNHQAASMHEMYKPQPAIIVEMEPHVHESPSQILVGSDYLEHRVRPSNIKPHHMMKPDAEKDEDLSLDEVPLQTWNTPLKGQDYHFITTEIVPMQKNHSANYNKTKITTTSKPMMDYKNTNNMTSGQTLTMYSEIPMIPVSVITADQIFTSTQKNKLNEKPIFQKLSTISPSTIMSTTKPVTESLDQKSDDISIISETHTTSIKYPGYTEIRVPTENTQTTVSVKTKSPMNEKITTSYTTPSSTKFAESTTEAMLLTTNTVAPETASTNKITQVTKIKDNMKPMIQVSELVTGFTTESTPEMNTETISLQDLTTIKDSPKKTTKVESATTEKIIFTTVTDSMFDKMTTMNEEKETSAVNEPMTTITPPSMNKLSDNHEPLSSDLANSLSSVISQVAETLPSLLGDTPNFPLSELKSNNISMSNELYDTTTIKDVEEESSSTTDLDSTSETSFEQQTVTEQYTITTDITTERPFETTVFPTEKLVTSNKLTDGELLESTTYEPEEKLIPITTILPNDASKQPIANVSELTTTKKSTEKRTEATIIHLDVTGTPTVTSIFPNTTERDNNTSESPLIRIQLADVVSAVNHVIEHSNLQTEVSPTVHNMTLPPNLHKASPNIASGLIAGFMPNSSHQTQETTTKASVSERPSTKFDDYQNQTTSKVDVPKINSSTMQSFSTNNVEKKTEMSNNEKTTPMKNVVTETTLFEKETQTTINPFKDEIVTTTFATTDKTDKSDVKYITTTEPISTVAVLFNKTKKPEIPINRIDISPESTSSNLPPRIQLTDLPIVEESTTLKYKVTVPTTIKKEPTTEKPLLQKVKNNTKIEDIHNEKLTLISQPMNNSTETLKTEVPSVSDSKNSSTYQNFTDNSVMATTVGDYKHTTTSKIESTTSKMNLHVTKNDTGLNNINLPSDIAQIQQPLSDLQSLDKLPVNYIEVKLKNESKISTEGPKPMKNVTEVMPGYTTNFSRNESMLSTVKTTTKDSPKVTTPLPSTPSKQESYIKLGEQTTKEPINKFTEINSMKPPKFTTKRPVTTTTYKPTTNKFINTPMQKITYQPKPTKAPTSTAPSQEKKPESEKWSLIPQQSSSPNANKMKEEVTESPMSSSTVFPSGDTNDYSPHRTGSKPVNLDVVKNSPGLDDSVRNLDEDIKFFANLCNELAFSFWSSANKGLSNSRSLALSPFGMTSMLAMIFLGARGPTSAQMNDILKLDDVATFNPHLVFQNITDAVSLARNQGIANAAFVRLLFADRIKVGKLMPFYKEQAQKFYEGFVAEVNFSTISDQVKRRTNLLVRKQTGGRIKDFVKTNSVPLRSPLAALSANVFQTNCNSTGASSEGRDGEMYFAVSPAVRQRRLVPVPATVWRSGVLAGYEPGLDATAVALGGTDKLVSTIFVIPGQQGFTAPGDTLDRLEQRLIRSAYRDKAWDKLLKVIIPRPALELQVPKFSHRSVVNATAALKRMGLEELFTRHANLKGINGFGHDIYLADVLQMNLFSTCGDENISSGRHHVEIYPGSPSRNNRDIDLELEQVEPLKDTATYDVNMPNISADNLAKNPRLVKNWSREVEVSEKPRLRLDRPFLYFVRHNPTGLILHMGRFNPRLLQ